MTAEYRDQIEYLRVRVETPWTFENAKKIMNEIKLQAKRTGHNRVLVDLSFWGNPDVEMTRFESAKYLAEVLPPPFKIAVFSLAAIIDSFGETVAINRGAKFRVFQDEQSAIEWLTK